MITISKGLLLPIEGEPVQEIQDGPAVKRVALIGSDYHGMKPTMAVKVGDKVKRGDLLFNDKKNEGVRFTSPASGTVAEVNRGAKRVFQSIVIDVEGEEATEFTSYSEEELGSLNSDQVRELLVESGLWTSFRTRPYSKIPAIDSTPAAIFVTAIDTNPLAADPRVVIASEEAHFQNGLEILGQLGSPNVFLCTGSGGKLAKPELNFIQEEEFAGSHPAGLPGTHIHMLYPASEDRVVWYLNYQDVIAIGKLFVEGKLPVDRVVAIGGPASKTPRLLRTQIGAQISGLVEGEVEEGEVRLISGSVFGGRTAAEEFDYLGRYHLQVSVIPEGHQREFLGWKMPGLNKFSVTRAFASALFSLDKKFRFTTTTHGSKRAMVPIGLYEKVMPLDMIPTFLLRALITGDTEEAKALGCMELDEDDLALCTFVCPGKYEYGPLLRNCLERIEKEG